MLRWLNREEFWAKLEASHVCLDYEGWCLFHISYADLCSKIGEAEPNKDLRGEDDLPGPVSRWYGDLSGILFLLDFHHSHPHGEVVVVHHSKQEGARDTIRDMLFSWGDKWQESPTG